MKKSVKKYGLLLLLTVSLLFTAVACDIGGGGQEKVIAIEDIVVDDKGVTVLYADGYALVLEERNLLQDPLFYTFVLETSTSDSVGGGQETGSAELTTKEIVAAGNTDAFYNGSVEYNTQQGGSFEFYTYAQGSGDKIYYSSTLQGARCLGVRVMGTKGADMQVYYSTTGSLEDGSTLLVGGNAMTVVSQSSHMVINGKNYENYETRAELAEYFATRLTQVTVPAEMPGTEEEDSNEVSVILANGFANMSALETVNLPKSIREIRAKAFIGCEALTDIFFDGTIEQWNAIKKASDWDESTGEYTVHCSDGDLQKGETSMPDDSEEDFGNDAPQSPEESTKNAEQAEK